MGEDGWTSVRNRRSSQPDDGITRWDGERQERERRDPLDIPLKLNGVGRGFDRPWIRPENGDSSDSKRPESSRATSWRERERNRDWSRGAKFDNQIEEQPEWMNDSPSASEDNQRKTQEEFQKWKEQMKMKDQGVPLKEKEETPEPIVSRPPPSSSTSTGALPTLGNLGMFGTFEDITSPDENNDPLIRPSPIKSKSRFEAMFKKEEPAPPPLPMEPSRPLSSGRENGNGNAEDKAGFERILAMLGNRNTPREAEGARHIPGPPMMSPFEGFERMGNAQRDENDFMEELLARQLGGARIGGGQQPPHSAHPFNERPAFPPANSEKDGPHSAGAFSPQQPNMQPMDRVNGPNPQQEYLYHLMMSQHTNMNRPPGGEPPLEFPPFGPVPTKGMPPHHQAKPGQHPSAAQRDAPSAPPGIDPGRMRLEQTGRMPNMPPGLGGPFPGFDHDHQQGPPMEQGMLPSGLNRRNTGEMAGLNAPQGARGPNGPAPAAPAQASNLGIPTLPRVNDMFLPRGAAAPPPGAMHDARMMPGPPPPGLMPNGPGGPPQQHQQGPPPNGLPGMPNGNAPHPSMRGPPGPNGGPMPPPGFPGGMPPPMNFLGGHPPPPFGMGPSPFFGPGPGAPMNGPGPGMNGMNGPGGPMGMPPTGAGGPGFFPGRFPFDGPGAGRGM